MLRGPGTEQLPPPEPAAPQQADRPDVALYLDPRNLVDALQRLVEQHPDVCRLGTIGSSRQGRDIWLLTLGRGADIERRPALVIVAGLDGDDPGSTPIAVRVAGRLMNLRADEPGADLLDRLTVYVLPRMNPDAAAFFFAAPRMEQRMALRPMDDDRDGPSDEDGPDDVNCDGLVTWMRVRDPDATHLPDPAEPRLLKSADRARGERPVYKLYREGVDDDGDGEYNEDGPGGVDLNLNFMHGYEEHKPGAGPHPVSEPESRALIDFFLSHPRINAVIVYGRHDNLVKTPEAGTTDVTGIAPVSLHKDDQAIYEHLGRRYRELTGIKDVPKEDGRGAFYLWAYAQFGIPALACRPWVCPQKSSQSEEQPAHPSDVLPADAPAVDPPPAASAREPDSKNHYQEPPTKKPDPADKEAAAWLAYSDAQCNGRGFVNWMPFDHPQLGPVEIGGFVPFFTMTPPPDAFDTLADKQFAFAMDVAMRLPRVRLEPVKVKALAAHVFEIQTAVVNDGYFPTALAMGRQNRRVRPIVLTLDVAPQRVLGGQRVERVWTVAGGGERQKLRWIVTGEPGEIITLTVTSEKFGDLQVQIPLIETRAADNDPSQNGGTEQGGMDLRDVHSLEKVLGQ